MSTTLHPFRFLLLALVAAAPLRAQLSMPDDSLLYWLQGDVLVTATRMPTAFGQAPASSDVYHGDDIARMPANSVADVLGRSVGLALQRYGGDGSLDLASFRGLGPEYTVVFLNGLRLNDAQNGLVDLSRIAAQSVGRIEVARGGFAALYGSEALGGVVDIRTRPAAAPVSLRAGAGSFGWRQADATVARTGSLGRVQLSARYEDARNDYPFVASRWPYDRHIRAGASYLTRRIDAEGLLTAGTSALSLYASAGNARTGVPGAFVSDGAPTAEQRDADAMVAAQYRMQWTPALLLEVSPTLRWSRQQYRDPSVLLAGAIVDSRYDNASASLLATLLATPSEHLRLLGGIDAGRATLRSADVSGDPRRLSMAAFAGAELRLPALAGVALYPSLRADFIDDAPGRSPLGAASPSLGAVWSARDGVVTLRARVSRGFRAPTFNQLYWRQGGNPMLRPDVANAAEAGLRLLPGAALPALDVTVYHHDISDKIVWMPGAGLFWTPKNLRRVRSRGIEARVDADAANGALRWSLGGQVMQAVKSSTDFPGDATAGKQLVYTPTLGGIASLDVAPASWATCSAVLRAVGPRYGSESNAPESRLDGFVTMDAAVSATGRVAGVACTLKLEALNCFDASYEMIALYPMPPRAFRCTVSIHPESPN